MLGEQVVPLAQLAGQTLSAELQRNGESVHSAIELTLSDCLATALWLARKQASLGRSRCVLAMCCSPAPRRRCWNWRAATA